MRNKSVGHWTFRSLPSSSATVAKLAEEQQRIQGRLAEFELNSTIRNGIANIALEDRKPDEPSNAVDMCGDDDVPSESQTPANGAGSPNGTRVEEKPTEVDQGAESWSTVYVSSTVLAKQKALAAWVSSMTCDVFVADPNLISLRVPQRRRQQRRPTY